MSQVIKQVDNNNLKALGIITLAIVALENGCDDFDVTITLEVIKDYLQLNNMIFDSLA